MNRVSQPPSLVKSSEFHVKLISLKIGKVNWVKKGRVKFSSDKKLDLKLDKL